MLLLAEVVLLELVIFMKIASMNLETNLDTRHSLAKFVFFAQLSTPDGAKGR